MTEQQLRKLQDLIDLWRYDANTTQEIFGGSHENVVAARLSNLSEGQLSCASELERALEEMLEEAE